MERLRFFFSLTVEAPFLFRGLQSGVFGLDAVQMRDESGRPVLPAAQARGVLKEALGDVASACPDIFSVADIHRLFGLGSRQSGEENNRPDRGYISIGDLVPEPDQLADGTQEEIVRVEIDDVTGAAKGGHLQFIESNAKTGAEVTFGGSIVAYWDRPQHLEVALSSAASLIKAVGAFKSIGFGRVLRSVIERDTSATVQASRVEVGQEDRLGFALRFDRPYLVDADRIVDNAFIGSVVVPGAVIKGAIANKISLLWGEKELQRLGSALSELVISHAFPENQAGEPGGEALPLSICMSKEPKTGELVVGDDLRIDCADEAAGPFLANQPVSFQPDWKADWHKEAGLRLGLPAFSEPRQVQRTRTRIDEETGTARDANLFTMVARSHVLPSGSAGNQQTQRRFFFTLDLLKAADDGQRAEMLQIIRVLLGGLDFVGKTDASVSIERWPDGDSAPRPRSVRGHSDLYAIVLKTRSILTDPRTSQAAFDAYRSYWLEHLGAELVDFCASQSLAGGYIAMRRRPWGEIYHPFVVTDPGSVFLIRNANPAQLSKYIRVGLPLPRFTDAEALTWRNCPYTPENGFGAIRPDYLSGDARFERIQRQNDV